jgi:hypothetical protein
MQAEQAGFREEIVVRLTCPKLSASCWHFLD